MIVNYQEDSWQIISQRTHGLLAGEICFHWKKELRPKNWLETIVATTEHDDVFNELDTDDKLLNTHGGPVNFKTREFEKGKCDQLLSYALTKSRYIALLTSRHIRFLYENSDNKEARKYTKDLLKQEIRQMKETGFTETELAYAYALLQWCDAFSLLICQQFIQPESRKIEISSGPDNRSYYLYAPAENQLIVEPWPFEEDFFEIHYESRTITLLTFRDVDEFRKKLMEAPVTLHMYRVSRKEMKG